MNYPVVYLLCLIGFMALALASYRQQRDVFRRSLSQPATRALRLGGMAALLLALSILVAWQGWGLGLVIFSGFTSLAAGIVYTALIIFMRRYA